MRTVGFSFSKQQLRVTVLEGTKSAPIFIGKDRLEYAQSLSPTDICVWMQRNFAEIINKFQPNRIAYRLSWSYNRQIQAYSLVYPCAILELISFNQNIPCQGFGYQALTHKALGFPKGSDLAEHCTALIGSHPPYWDIMQINSALAAIAGMD